MEEKIYCFGCGSVLQDADENKDGYIDPRAWKRKENILCRRCFQLKHYGKFSASSLVKNTLDWMEKSVKKDDLLVLLVDCALIRTPLIPALKKLKEYPHLIVLANRCDLYKNYISETKLLNFLRLQCQKEAVFPEEILLIQESVDALFTHLCEKSIGRNIVLLGLENAGKTTFVNKILKSMQTDENALLVHSKYPGTTVDLIRIPLDEKTFLIDSPGIYSKGNFLHLFSKEEIQTFALDRKVCEYTYQLNPNQSLLIANLCRVDFLNQNRISVQLYLPDSLQVIRCKQQNAQLTFNHQIPYLPWKSQAIKNLHDLCKKTIQLTKNQYHDIVIEGLGFIRVPDGKYILYLPDDVNFYTRKSMF